jgi:asparagine synthase (glutamine-hydrolysing)
VSAIGVFFQRDGAPADASGAVTRALTAMRDRGPDARRVWSADPDGVAVGHGLLATTPEDDLAPQPHCAEGGGLVVALDGRLDNRRELSAALGVPEAGTTDAALVAAAHARWGEAFDEHLIGDFAVVLWDARRRALVAARDVVGGRPLYYRESRGALACASSPWALFAATSEAPAPSFEAMALFLVERMVERPHTLFEGVRALVPGGSLRATAGAAYVSAAAWPAPVRRSELRGAREREEALRETLREAVRARLRARGPVAVHVSGGIDSSSVAAIAVSVAREEGRSPPVLVRCVFPGLACDESAYSQAVADHLGLPIETVTMPGDVQGYLPDAASLPRGRFENPVSHMLTEMIDRARERGARVTLTGAGSDQLLQPTGLELASVIARGDVGGALALSGIAGAPLSAEGYRRLLRRGLARALPERVRRAVRAARGKVAGPPAWMTPRARRVVDEAGDPHLDDPRAFPSPAVRRLAARLAWDADYSYSITLADQIAAAKGAELRHPFFDRRVIDLLLSFPDEERAAAPPEKVLLRRAMGSALPQAVAERTSAAEFSPFVTAALVEPHAEAVAALIRRGRLADEGLVDPNAAADVVLSARSRPETLREVVTLLSLELWLRQVRP